MDDSMESHEMSPAPNSPGSPLLEEDRSQRSVAFSPEAPIVREVTPRKTQSQPSFADDLKKWWDNPPSEVWVALTVTLVLLLIAIIVIIVKSANYNSLLRDSKNGYRLASIRMDDRIMSRDPFTITIEIDDINQLTATGTYSPTLYFHDMPWQLSVTKESSARTHYVDFLAVFIYCNWESENRHWRVDYDVHFVLLNKRVEKLHESLRCKSFSYEENSRGIYALIRFEDLLEDGKDFLDGKRLTVECRIIVDKVTGIRKRSVLDFLTPVDGMNNIALNIGDCKLYASKDILAAHSPEFASMFFGKSEDTKLDELELHDVEYRDFVLLLNVIYPTSFEITVDTVLLILKLAVRYKIESVLDRIIAYFICTARFTVAAKLKIAGQFRLQRLIDFCISSFEDIEEIKSIKTTPEYKFFTESVRAALCDRMLEF